VAGYAAREGVDVATFLQRRGATLTAEQVSNAVVNLATDPSLDRDAYLITPTGLSPVG